MDGQIIKCSAAGACLQGTGKQSPVFIVDPPSQNNSLPSVPAAGFATV